MTEMARLNGGSFNTTLQGKKARLASTYELKKIRTTCPQATFEFSFSNKNLAQDSKYNASTLDVMNVIMS